MTLEILILDLLALAALMLAVVGAFVVARAFSEGRVLNRRLNRAEPAPEPDPASEAAAQAQAEADATKTPVARFLDARIPWLRRGLAAAGAPFTPEQVAVASLALSAAMFITLELVGTPTLIALPAAIWAGVAGPMLVISFLAKRRRAQFQAQMPQTIDLIARSLQAGHPVSTAMAVAAHQMPDPIGPEFAKVMGEINYGGDRDAALRAMLERFPLPDLQMFAASLEVTRETGGNVAEVLLKLGDTMRSKAQLRGKVDALSAEGKLSFWVISSLPVLVVGALLLLQPDYYRQVAGDPLFWPMMSVPPMLLIAGALMIWRMINIRV